MRPKLYHFMVENLVLVVKWVFVTIKWYNLCLQIIQTQIVLSIQNVFLFILIKSIFKTFLLCCYMYVALLRMWWCCFQGLSAMILIMQIFDVIANENACFTDPYLGIEFYLFVSHGGMNDRGSTCKFRNARSAFRNLHVDPLSFIPPWETNK